MDNTKDYKTDVLKKIDNDLQDSDQAIKNLKAHSKMTAETTGKKLEYGKSRWDFEKKRSLERGAYHFDWTKKDNIDWLTLGTEVKQVPELIPNTKARVTGFGRV